MTCSRERSHAFLDGELNVAESCDLMRHLEGCAGCREHLEQLRLTRRALAMLPAPEPPPGLALRIRVAASRHAAPLGRLAYVRLRWRLLLQSLAVPAVAGMMGALCFCALLVGSVGRVWMAATPPTPAMLGFTPAVLISAPDYNPGSNLMVVAEVDATGHVKGYRLLDGPKNRRLLRRLSHAMHKTVFRPAMVRGKPTASQTLLAYNSIRVRG